MAEHPDVSYEALLTLARSLEDVVLTTPRGHEFTVSTYLDSLVFTPASTGLGRSDGRKAAERFVDRYNATRSLRPSDYGDVTRNASYLIGLVVAPTAPRAIEPTLPLVDSGDGTIAGRIDDLLDGFGER